MNGNATVNGASGNEALGPHNSDQIASYSNDRQAKSQDVVYTTSNGAPVAHAYASQRAGYDGPLLLQDFHLIDLLAHFDRESIKLYGRTVPTVSTHNKFRLYAQYASPVLHMRSRAERPLESANFGVHYQQLPVKQPAPGYQMGNFQRDGPMAFDNQSSRPNYLSSVEPISFKKARYDVNKVHGQFIGEAVSFLTEVRPEDFTAARNLWTKVFDTGARERFIETVVGHIGNCKDGEVIKRQIAIFRQVSPDIAEGLEKGLKVKGYDSLENMTLLGSNNGMGKKLGANGLSPSDPTVNWDNGAPRPSQAVKA